MRKSFTIEDVYRLRPLMAGILDLPTLSFGWLAKFITLSCELRVPAHKKSIIPRNLTGRDRKVLTTGGVEQQRTKETSHQHQAPSKCKEGTRGRDYHDGSSAPGTFLIILDGSTIKIII